MTKTSRNLLIIVAAVSIIVVAIFAYMYVQSQKNQNSQSSDIFSQAIEQAPSIGDPQKAIQGIDK